MGLIDAYYQAPFILRLGVLVAFLVVVAGLERVVKGVEASRFREYRVWFACGLAGGGLGVTVDIVTFHLSPAYFELGKGIGEAKLLDALGLGFEAGFLAGMVVGGLFLWVGQARGKFLGLAYRRIGSHLLWPAGLAVLGAFLNPIALQFDLAFSEEDLHAVLVPSQVEQFLTVAQIHLGLYSGGFVGTAIGALAIARAKRLHPVGAASQRNRERTARMS